ncbi:MAG: phosphatidylglycerol lysyltransferase domain-containing protein [Acidobacteriota bacterium]
MRSRSVLTHVVAVTVLGSGLVNVFSVIGPALPERATILHGLFPLEFAHLSRFATLLIGFALIISSINVSKRKKRAFRLVVVLSVLSLIFHLTKGLDYEEAAFSAALLVLLYLARKRFVVGSNIPDLRGGLMQLGTALLAALLYGVAGFWLLDAREFGITFTVGDALHRSLLFLSLAGDPQVVAHTRYARWFVDSMYLMTATAIAYSLLAVFRPVVYQYRTLPQERKLAESITAGHGRSAIDFFKYWPDKNYSFSPSRKTYVAYKVGGGYALALGDPVGPEEEIEPAIRQFLEMCDQNDWRPAFHQTLPDFLPVYRKLGLRKLKIGDDAVVELVKFTLDGKHAKKFRHTINQLEKDEFRFVRFAPPLPEETLGQLEEVSDEWLQIPGRRERSFTLGLFDPDYIRGTPAYAAVDGQDRIWAFANEIPSFTRGEATIDLMRYRPSSPPATMEYLFCKLLLAKKAEGFARFNMGMAPMAGFQEREESSLEERAVHHFMQRLNFLFSYEGLRAYKAKFATLWEPRFLVYRNILSLPLVARAITEVSELHD